MLLKNTRSKRDNSIGQVFTPSYIAEFMVSNLFSFIENSGKIPKILRVLEPSVGEGIFLDFLLKSNIFNITAYEMDYSLKEYLLNSYPNVTFKFENFLGSDPSEKFDLIIGNPPYLGQNYNSEVFQEYIKEYPFCAKYFVGNMDLFYFFIHLGIEKLNPGGLLTFITTHYWITKSKKTGIKLLKPHVLSECFLRQYIDLSRLQLFEGAKGQRDCIFVLQKKTEVQKFQKKNKNIEIIQVFVPKELTQENRSINEEIFKELTCGKDSKYLKKFISVVTNNDLKIDESWNLIYPKEVQTVVDKIENLCKVNGKVTLLKDYFVIRNGLILIKDSIFILSENRNLLVKDNDFFILINGEFIKLNKTEKFRLKKIYKSKSVKTYGYNKEEHIGYVIYFNKNEFNSKTAQERNHFIEIKYPNLSKYLKQFETELKDILINAKENPKDIYFPRRGSFIRIYEGNQVERLIDLEPFYDSHSKIFFKFITDRNIFGYSNEQYYATSDTYFLWPKSKEKDINYLFILAYLNSKITNFLFKSKNITIKRSKTKLEQTLPIPQFENFKTPHKHEIINLIKDLTNILINIHIDFENLINKFSSLGYYSIRNYNELKKKIINAIENKNSTFIKDTIDTLFFQLFELNQIELKYLLKEYYYP